MTFKHKNPDTGADELYTYDVADLPNQGEKITEQSPPIDSTLQDVKHEVTNKDISVRTKKTLSQYISDKSRGKSSVGHTPHASSYPIDAGSTTTETHDASGFPRKPATLGGNTTKHITDRFKQDHESSLRSVSDDYVYASDKNNFSVTKGLVPELERKNRAQEVVPDGNKLLIDDANVSKISDRYVDRAVLRHNRFTVSVPASSDTSVAYGGATPGQNNLQNPNTISQGRLANVGALLSLKGSNEWGSNDPGRNPNSGGTEAKAALPSLEQLGTQRINIANFDVKNVLETLTTSEDSVTLEVNDKSWGALNNVLDHFSGMSAAGMATLSIALSASVMALAASFGFIISKAVAVTPVKKDEYGRYPLGANTAYPNSGTSIIPPKVDVNELLGLRRTEFPLDKAINAGIAVFFGLDTSSKSNILMKNLRTTVSKAFDAPGFYVIVGRAMMRSGITIADYIRNAFSGNVVSAVKQMMGMFETIRRSKFIATLNMFATIGDLSLKKDASLSALKSPNGEHPDRDSVFDIADPVTSRTVEMERLRGSLRLAWGSHRAHSMYMESPFTTFVSRHAFGQIEGSITSVKSKFVGVHGNDSRFVVKSTTSGRISTTEREKFEEKLDAEYVPFYFHDLRTNEIISFHAFLTSLTDDYAPNWENVEGIGRIDPVVIYKNTHRKISLSFYVVSTSKDDFDAMWVKLNKLTTLVYPQFTRGKTIYDGDTVDTSENVVTQPFSQVVGASPLIRLRLGDLFKTNYSKFNLVKLFGIDTDEFKLGDVKNVAKMVQDKVGTINEKISAEYTNYVFSKIIPPNNYKFAICNGAFCTYMKPNMSGKTGATVSFSTPSKNSVFTYAKEFQAGVDPVRGMYVKPEIVESTIVGYDGENPIVKIEFKKNVTKEQAKQIAAATEHIDGENRLNKIIGGTYKVNKDQLVFTDSTKKFVYDKYYAQLANEVGTQAFDKIADFMNEKKNALVRSFKESGGKGLAGKIDSLNFDWYDRIVWETDNGSTAPMICKVTMGYTPIHDIAPGLDWRGDNRAPIYRVGSAYSSTDALEKK
jgi:hypothetical protein